MSSFDIAIETTLHNEGGYSFDPRDPGGETFVGISRKNFPNWPGWQQVDAIKQTGSMLIYSTGMSNPLLQQMVRDFYRVQFWLPLYDHIENQDIATRLFDCGVNCGMTTAVRLLQKAMQKVCVGPVVIDGKFGQVTLDFVNKVDQDKLLPAFRAQRAKYYLQVVIDHPMDTIYIDGWLERAVQ